MVFGNQYLSLYIQVPLKINCGNYFYVPIDRNNHIQENLPKTGNNNHGVTYENPGLDSAHSPP